MNKWHKETEKVLLDNEEQALNDLKQSYTQSLAKVKKKLKQLDYEIQIMELQNPNDPNIRSKIYQLNYQKALEEQINNAMLVLNDENTQTIQAFLTRMYEDGYITQQYVINKYGIPVITPINHDLLVQSINTKVDGYKFSERLYEDIKSLSYATKTAISDGFIRGKGYAEIAKEIANYSEASLKRAYTIARTEGRRVSNQAKYQSQMDAKAKGADIVKQWDSTLDGKTRPEHRALDGQVREIDENFEYEGMKAKEPTMFGVAHMDINCRCVSLTMPRKYVGTSYKRDGMVTEKELKIAYKKAKENGALNELLENETGLANELKKVDNYQQWKDKYYKGANF